MLKATYKHTGKMEGMTSLSTYFGKNPFCLAHREIKGSICEKCFVPSALRFKNNDGKYIENYNILTSREITTDEIKSLKFDNLRFVRLEAFGDIANAQQMENYVKICNYYKDTRFTLWTKNPLQVNLGLHHEKPKNLTIILSSLMINKEVDASGWWFVDKVFTVYDKKYIEENNVKINCGARDCLGCMKCYKKNNIKKINEVLK